MTSLPERVVLIDDPHVDWADAMEFRLTYRGPLLTATSDRKRQAGRANHKQNIRQALHPQLRRCWEVMPQLNGKTWSAPVLGIGGGPVAHDVPTLAARFAIGNYNIVPMLTRDLFAVCGLDVLLLRPDGSDRVGYSGDIDNQLKTLIDGLQAPRETGQFGDYQSPRDGETPFFCLLQDDSLITRLSVQTDRLLTPPSGPESSDDVLAIITVKLTSDAFDTGLRHTN